MRVSRPLSVSLDLPNSRLTPSEFDNWTDIVQYLDSSTDGQHLNIFLEYVPGGSVAALLSNYGAFEEALVGKFVRQILTGLEYLHGREIIHRDIKGANILVDNKGNIKISDFGISKKVEDSAFASYLPHFAIIADMKSCSQIFSRVRKFIDLRYKVQSTGWLPRSSNRPLIPAKPISGPSAVSSSRC